jgi:hypothetical protein
VTIGMDMRKVVSGAVLALAMAIAVVTVPGHANAKSGDMPAGMTVCNTANPHSGGGNLDVVAGENGDPQGGLKNSQDMRSKGGGNYNAAVHSRALALCAVPTTDAPDDGGDGGWGGSGV